MIPQSDLPKCRFCGATLKNTFVDLGMQPLCESYLRSDQLNHMEPFFPLHVYVCSNCFLVQLEEYVAPEEIFSEYAYFSSYSDSWLRHSENYVDMIVNKLGLGEKSHVVELGSNDGYLLQYFKQKGIPVLGVEPAANVAEVAISKGIPTLIRFFDPEVANDLVNEDKQADLIIGNNVLAQVPDLNGFVEGIRILIKPLGVITIEFPHLLRLMDGNQFDTIYHEHFSYFSFVTVEKVFAAHGLRIFDVEELSTHGGSLRIYACTSENTTLQTTTRVDDLREREIREGFQTLEKYQLFSELVKETKRGLLDLLIRLKRSRSSIVGYGAPGKGNTLLNYCGIRADFLDYTVDRNPYKQGKFLPGSHVPIYPPDMIKETKPNYVFILPWNIKDEIMEQMSFIKDWGGKFIIPIPEVKIYDAHRIDKSNSLKT
jgi:SAM-dependent methyltransferase